MTRLEQFEVWFELGYLAWVPVLLVLLHGPW